MNIVKLIAAAPIVLFGIFILYKVFESLAPFASPEARGVMSAVLGLAIAYMVYLLLKSPEE